MRSNKVDIVACLETRVKQPQSQTKYKKLGDDWNTANNYACAPNGRIWIIWKWSNVHVVPLRTIDQMIHCWVREENSTFSSYITFVYGLHSTQQRASLWDTLRTVNYNGPWLIIGDFNSVLGVEDRLNGQPVHHSEMTDFQNCIDDIGVGQITKRGNRYSWSNKRDSENRIYSHINWAFGNPEWFNTNTGVEAVYMLPGCSDHTPIMLNTEVVKTRMNRPYRLLTIVMQQEDYRETVQQIWSQQHKGFTMYSVWNKLQQLQQTTIHIHKEHNSVEQKLQQIREELNVTHSRLNEDHFNRQEIQKEKQLRQIIEK